MSLIKYTKENFVRQTSPRGIGNIFSVVGIWIGVKPRWRSEKTVLERLMKAIPRLHRPITAESLPWRQTTRMASPRDPTTFFVWPRTTCLRIRRLAFLVTSLVLSWIQWPVWFAESYFWGGDCRDWSWGGGNASSRATFGTENSWIDIIVTRPGG